MVSRGIGVFGFLGVTCYIVGWITLNSILEPISNIFGAIVFVCFVSYISKTSRFLVVKRLFKEPNVIIIVVLTLCNLVIDIGRPHSSFSAINGFMYLLIINAFVFTDALILKSRYLIVGFGILFVVLSFYNLYEYTFGSWDNGIVLLKYNIQGNDYTFMKRSTKRSIFLQLILFSANGIYTMLTDKKMELMIFATGNVFKKEIYLSMKYGTTIKTRIIWAQRGLGIFTFLGICVT